MLIEQFINEYEDQIKKFEELRDHIHKELEKELRISGIMAIVTSRLKDSKRLEAKLYQRNLENQYTSIEQIHKDIVDLIGVRVALYFPSDSEKVGNVIKEIFKIESTKTFPNDQRKSSEYTRRFVGYCATHYRIFDIKSNNSVFAKRNRVEIQVASLLMHAWSEVEHDLVYKKMQGNLTIDEHETLDEINGLVVAGEISLSRLQRIKELRIQSENIVFENHYLLASYIYDYFKMKTPSKLNMGDTEFLFSFLKDINRLTPMKIKKDLDKIELTSELDISSQIIELNNKIGSKSIINTLKERLPKDNSVINFEDDFKKIGEFIDSWIRLERLLKQLNSSLGFKNSEATFKGNLELILLKEKRISITIFDKCRELRTFRNLLVHGIEKPDNDVIIQRTKDVIDLTEKIRIHSHSKNNEALNSKHINE